MKTASGAGCSAARTSPSFTSSTMLKKILCEGSSPSRTSLFTGIFVERVCPNGCFIGIRAHFSLNLRGGNHREVPHPHQGVGRRGEGEDPSYFEDSAMPRLAQHPHGL